MKHYLNGERLKIKNGLSLVDYKLIQPAAETIILVHEHKEHVSWLKLTLFKLNNKRKAIFYAFLSSVKYYIR